MEKREVGGAVMKEWKKKKERKKWCEVVDFDENDPKRGHHPLCFPMPEFISTFWYIIKENCFYSYHFLIVSYRTMIRK